MMKKACIAAHYAITPLGAGSMANYMAVRDGFSALQYREGLFGLSEPTCASVMDYDALRKFVGEKASALTNFETLCVASAAPALVISGINPASPDVRFAFSTTKANVSLMGLDEFSNADVAAAKVVAALGGITSPIVVSNACISGLAAQIVAKRLIERGEARYVVVIGADELSRFVVSGFQSFKALSTDVCRPFDANRNGLNLGEASATIIFEAKENPDVGEFVLSDGAICNDANHISGPSRTGEGLFRCIKALNISKDNKPGFINAHGTATLYNDEMESIAISRADLLEVPVYSLKGHFGHTLGAAGVLETIISLMAAEEGYVLPTIGFAEHGVGNRVNVSAEGANSGEINSFAKIMSGFGGVNAAVRFCRGAQPENHEKKDLFVVDSCIIDNSENLEDLYRSMNIKYPKFHKMDGLCKLSFLAAEKLLGAPDGADAEQTAVVLVSQSGCNHNDARYYATIGEDDFYPSPAIFVYTLPNIATGEIAIRHHLNTETSAYLISPEQTTDIYGFVSDALADASVSRVLLLMADYNTDGSYRCNAMLIGTETTTQPFNIQTILKYGTANS